MRNAHSSPTILFNSILCLLLWLGFSPLPLGVADEFRTWRDATGKFEVEAVLVSQSEEQIVLRNREDREIKVSKDRLSAEDLQFLEEKAKESEPSPPKRKGSVNIAPSKRSSSSASMDAEGATPTAETEPVRKIAEAFFKDLLTKERIAARDLLTDPGQELVAANKSLLPFLPTPDAGARAIRVGKAKINKNQATVVVQVTVGGDVQRIVLSMKQSDEQWRVAAISAEREDVETTIDFEQPFNPNVRPPDPAQQWLGQSVAIAGITLDGRRVSLQDYKGKVVLIDFWATWCGPCIKEMPNIYQNYTKYHDAGFEVLAISLDEEMPELQAFLAKENPPWLVLADKHPQNRESMSQKYKIQAIPTLLLVGPDGKVLDVDCRGPKLGARLAQIFGG